MNKTALITGASRGIGAAAARLFAENGYNVAINYHRSEAAAKALAAELGAFAVKADVSDIGEVREMAARVYERFGAPGVLVNNAGIAEQKLFCDISQGDWDRMFDINVKGAFNTSGVFLPGMIREKSGKIINISSIWGLVGASCEVHYSAAKAALIGFTKALAKEVAPSGITVNCVAPGVIKTDMNAALDGRTVKELEEETPLGRLGTPREVAQAILFLASENADFITGQVLSPNGGIVI